MNHDHLFKELIANFFAEFLKLFLPNLAARIDFHSVTFLDKEIFTDIAAGKRHEVDLLVKTRFRGGGGAYFLIHIETQSKAQARFPRRMFYYFALLHVQQELPVYPLAVPSRSISRCGWRRANTR